MSKSFIPLLLRKVANGVVAFKLNNMHEIITIYDKFVIGLSKEQYVHGHTKI